MAYGSVDFVATVATNPVAALRAIPETVEHAGNEIWNGGALLAAGSLSEGVTRVLDGVTCDVMVILGARGALRGAVKMAPEAARLAQEGVRSMTPAIPDTPFNAWMSRRQRGAVVIPWFGGRSKSAQPPADPHLIFKDANLTNGSIADPFGAVLTLLNDLAQRDPEFSAPYIQVIARQADRVPVAARALEKFLSEPEHFHSEAAVAIRVWRREFRDQPPQSTSIDGDGFDFHDLGAGKHHATPATGLLAYARHLSQPWMTWLIDGVLQAVPGNSAIAGSLTHVAKCFTIMGSEFEPLSHYIVTGLLDVAQRNPNMAAVVLNQLRLLAGSHELAFAAEHIPILRAMADSRKPLNWGVSAAPRVQDYARTTLELLQESRSDLF